MFVDERPGGWVSEARRLNAELAARGKTQVRILAGQGCAVRWACCVTCFRTFDRDPLADTWLRRRLSAASRSFPRCRWRRGA